MHVLPIIPIHPEANFQFSILNFKLVLGPILLYQLTLDVHLIGLEVLTKQAPGNVEHFCSVEVDVDSQELV